MARNFEKIGQYLLLRHEGEQLIVSERGFARSLLKATSQIINT